MATHLTSKGQVTIPKHIREALSLQPGAAVDFAVNPQGEVVLQRVAPPTSPQADRFEAARGKAEIHWKTDELMALLRHD